jgi:hypothetical protein
MEQEDQGFSFLFFGCTPRRPFLFLTCYSSQRITCG